MPILFYIAIPKDTSYSVNNIREAKKAGIGIQPGNAWFMSETGSEQYFQLGYYKIAKLVVPHRDVDTFLKRQLNDNLASIFG